MNAPSLRSINYNFSRNILASMVVKNPESFYTKFISEGHNIFLNSMKKTWINYVKSYDSVDRDILSRVSEIDMEVAHVYDNGDFFILLRLPSTTSGCDSVGMYVYETFDGSADSEVRIKINYYLFHVETHVGRYSLLQVYPDLSIRNLGYIPSNKSALITNISKKNKKECYRVNS